MAYLDHIRDCNNWNPADFAPFYVDGERLGMIRPAFADHLRRWPEVFKVESDSIHWIHPAHTFDDRSRLLHDVLAALVEEGVIAYLHGERYPMTAGNRHHAVMLIDRACAPYFGLRAFGQHLNGFVREGERIAMWVGRRAADRRLYPLKLDNLVAGGLPWGIGLADNLRKECKEEAGIDAELADQARPVGAVAYCRTSERGLKPDVIYCYDLELPPDFKPVCTDGEVETFYIRPVEEVMQTVRDSDEFKLNCNLVIIDFLLRHGLIPADAPDYLDIAWGLRARLP